MKITDLHDSIENRFDRLDNKLDNHLDRISTSEADISWMKAHMKVGISIGLAILGALLTYIINTLKG